MTPPTESLPQESKGLESEALGFFSVLTVGVSSVAPAYSLSAVLGPIVAVVGLHAPLVIVVAVVPMLLVAVGAQQLNAARTDCGTVFTWAGAAVGPRFGWLAGWLMLIADIIAGAALAQVAGSYAMRVLGLPESTVGTTAGGAACLVLVGTLCLFRVEWSARAQRVMLGCELAVLLLFAIAALVEAPHLEPAVTEHAPASLSTGTAAEAGLLAVYLYAGWDGCMNLNEETRHRRKWPGIAALVALVVVGGVYALVAVAGLRFRSPEFFADAANVADVLGALAPEVLGPRAKWLMTVAVLISSIAGAQVVILAGARTLLAMGAAGAIPSRFARVDPRRKTPTTATLVAVASSLVVFCALAWTSEAVAREAVMASSLCIALYYAAIGFSSPLLFRARMFESPRRFVRVALAPGLGALAFLWVCEETIRGAMARAGRVPMGLWLAVGLLGLGVAVMILRRVGSTHAREGAAAADGD